MAATRTITGVSTSARDAHNTHSNAYELTQHANIDPDSKDARERVRAVRALARRALTDSKSPADFVHGPCPYHHRRHAEGPAAPPTSEIQRLCHLHRSESSDTVTSMQGMSTTCVDAWQSARDVSCDTTQNQRYHRQRRRVV